MKVTIELPDNVAARLEAKAKLFGVPVETLIVRDVVAADHPPEEEKARRRREAYEEIMRIRKEVKLVDSDELRQMIEEGRRF